MGPFAACPVLAERQSKPPFGSRGEFPGPGRRTKVPEGADLRLQTKRQKADTQHLTTLLARALVFKLSHCSKASATS